MTSSSPLPARPRWRAALATFALVGALFAAGSAPANAEVVGTGAGTISGTVTDTNGAAIPGVYISVSSTSTDGGTTTDASGNYELSGIGLGDETYVNVFAQGYLQHEGSFVTLTEAEPTLQLDITLTPYATGVGTVSGHVTGDGQPLSGVYVSANNYETGQGAESVVTDADGYYQFTGLPNGTWQIYAFAGNQYQTVQDPIVTISDAAPDATADIAFVSYPSGTSTITGILTSSATGEPIADVNVGLFGNDVPQVSNTTTNADGEFTFGQLPAGNFSLSYLTSDFLDLYEDITVAADETVTANHVLIARNATVTGHLELADGTPVADTWVSAEQVGGFDLQGGVSDANGDYVISNLGAVDYTLRIGGFGSPYAAQERDITAIANDTVVANFTLTPRLTGTLMGTVLEPNGDVYTKPICATLYSSKTKKAVAERYIDGEHYGSDEFWFFDLKPGKYTVEVRDCDDDPTTKFDKVFLGGAKSYKDATFVTISAAEDSWGNDIVFAPRG